MPPDPIATITDADGPAPAIPAFGIAPDDFVLIEGDTALVVVDTALYSPRSIRRAAFRLLGSCTVHLRRRDAEGAFMAEPVTQDGTIEPGENSLITVRLRCRSGGTEKTTEAAVDAFLDFLLDETLREEVGRETEPVRNLILAHALSDIAVLRPELETAEPADDPLGIGLSDRRQMA